MDADLFEQPSNYVYLIHNPPTVVHARASGIKGFVHTAYDKPELPGNAYIEVLRRVAIQMRRIHRNFDHDFPVHSYLLSLTKNGRPSGIVIRGRRLGVLLISAVSAWASSLAPQK